MINALMALCVALAACIALAAMWQRKARQYERMTRELMAQNEFLEHELELAVNISKRLDESLTRRFSLVYGNVSLAIDDEPNTLDDTDDDDKQPAHRYPIYINGKRYA